MPLAKKQPHNVDAVPMGWCAWTLCMEVHWLSCARILKFLQIPLGLIIVQ